MLNIVLKDILTVRALTGFQKLIRWQNLLIIVLTQYLVKIFLVGTGTELKAHLLDYHFFLLVASTIAIAAAGYIINDYYDIKIDTINRPGRVVVGTIFRRRFAMTLHLVLNFVGIAIGFFLSLKIGAVNFVAAFWLWFYSNQLKRMPFIGNLSIAALTALSILVVGIYYSSQNILIVVFAVFAFFISLIREIIKDMEDLRGDMHFGCKTLPIIWGIRKTKTLVFFILGTFISIIFVLRMMTENTVLHNYFTIMAFPTIYFIYQFYWADTKKAYARLSLFCKLIMLSGVLLIIFI